MIRPEKNSEFGSAKYLDFLALIAGLIAPLSFSPFELDALIFLSLACLFFCWHQASPGRAFIRGLLFGLGQFGVGTWWVYISMHDYGGAGIIAAGALSALFITVVALFPAMVGFTLKLCFKFPSPISFVSVYPIAWTIAEWCRSWIINGFPWLQVGYTQLDSPLAGFIPLAGAYGESWLVACLSGLLATIVVLPKWKKSTPVVAAILIIGTGQLLKQIQWTHPVGEAFTATLLQGSIPQSLKWLPEQRLSTLNLYADLTRKHFRSDVIIWPETAVPAFYHQVEQAFFSPLKKEVLAHGADLVFGVPVWEESTGRYYNAVVTLGENDGIYKKRHLVPFGEFLPLQPVSGFIADLLEIPLSDFSVGADRQTPMIAAGQPFVASICYEDIYGDESLDGLPTATFLVNVTNDAWFGDSIAPHQHLQMARMRSLETGRYMLRATNTGVTAVIAPTGKIISTAPMFKTTALTEKITPMGGSTPYIDYGDKPILVGLFSLLGIALLLQIFASKTWK